MQKLKSRKKSRSKSKLLSKAFDSKVDDDDGKLSILALKKKNLTGKETDRGQYKRGKLNSEGLIHGAKHQSVIDKNDEINISSLHPLGLKNVRQPLFIDYSMNSTPSKNYKRAFRHSPPSTVHNFRNKNLDFDLDFQPRASILSTKNARSPRYHTRRGLNLFDTSTFKKEAEKKTVNYRERGKRIEETPTFMLTSKKIKPN